MPGGDVIRDPAPRRRRRGQVARHRERRQGALRDAQPGKKQIAIIRCEERLKKMVASLKNFSSSGLGLAI